jgi:hypothetical protein
MFAFIRIAFMSFVNLYREDNICVTRTNMPKDKGQREREREIENKKQAMVHITH